MDKLKIKDYATTLALSAIPVIVAYQAEIGKYIPVEYALIFTLGIGVLSQVMANKRVKVAYADTSAGLDIAQAKALEYQAMVIKLQEEIDQRQALVDTVAGLKKLDNAPIEDAKIDEIDTIA